MPDQHEHPHDETTKRRGMTEQPSGRQYWRSLDELANTPEFQQYVHREFPEAASEWHDPISRRNFLTLMGASLALAGATGCNTRQDETIVPYVQQPEQLIPGQPLYYATAFPFRGYGIGVLVESHMGRPTKIEGNPSHPASLGATNAQAQASILTMYDPDRAQTTRYAGEVRTWSAFLLALREEMTRFQAVGGQGLRILTQTITSPTLAKQLRELLAQYPQARWHQYEPVNRDSVRAGATAAFGQDVNTIYRFDQADVVVSLDANFLLDSPGSVRYARDFIDRRRARKQEGKPATMSRLYVVESTPTVAGAMADNRRSVRASQIEQTARALHAALSSGQTPEDPFIRAVAADLSAARGRGIVIAGEGQPPAVHALVAAMNQSLGNIGQTILHTAPIEANPTDSVASLRDLVADMRSGSVSALFVLDGNPVYDAPADLDFVGSMKDVKLRVHHSLYYNETSFHCHWHVPESHWLEAWSDIRAFDGTVTIMQPLILPLYQTHSAHELLAAMLGDDDSGGQAIVRSHWQQSYTGDNFDLFWQTSLHEGVVANSAAPLLSVPQVAAAALTPSPQPLTPANGVEVVFKPDPCIFDGRWANNGWLQELPKPLTKLTWDNAALVSPATARNRGWTNQQLLRLRSEVGEIRLPVWIMSGHPDDAITVYLGYGRTRAGRVGTQTANSGGFNAYAIRTSQSPCFTQAIDVSATDTRYPLACTQDHQLIPEGRESLMQVQTLAQFNQIAEESHGEGETGHGQKVHLSLYPEHDYTNRYAGQHSWGMSIDMTSCIGCNACVVACQAENLIPTVGKTEVIRGREMHWMRIDTYYQGNEHAPLGPYFQPMLCQHCENAPCEVVCPVAATTHSAEGLNEMTYNRCIGTRYCSNNCPYKVRRFNFFQYADHDTESLKLMRNPDVTVRVRGVMEKCTFCVQRINQTRIERKTLQAKAVDAPSDEARRALLERADDLLDGLQTACQQVCPTQAIIFGDLNQTQNIGRPSKVELAKAQPHNYGVLTELNTQPRTTYLARVVNPNPDVPAEHEKRPEKQEAKGQ